MGSFGALHPSLLIKLTGHEVILHTIPRSALLLLLRAYAVMRLALMGNFDFYADGFKAIAQALPKLEETW